MRAAGGERTPPHVGAICADVEVGSAGKGAPPRPIDRVRPQLTGRGEGATTGGGGAATTARRRWGRRMRAAGGERTRAMGLGVDAGPNLLHWLLEMGGFGCVTLLCCVTQMMK